MKFQRAFRLIARSAGGILRASALGSLLWSAGALGAAGEPIPILSVVSRDATVVMPTDNGWRMALEWPHARVVQVRLGRTLERTKLRIRLDPFDRGITGMRVSWIKNGQSFDEARSKRVAVLENLNQYDVEMKDRPFDTLLLEFDFFKPDLGVLTAHLAGIEAVPLTRLDVKYVVYPLALLVAVAFLLPGFVWYPLLTQDESPTRMLCLAPALSVAYWFVLFLVMYASHTALGGANAWLVGGLWLLGVAAGFVLMRRLGRFAQWRALLRGARPALLAFAALLLASTWIVTHDTQLPLANVHFKTVSGPKTYWAFIAHDNLFQYLNGKILAERIPWEQEYGTRGRPLQMFLPQDREMLPGALYAPLRKGLAIFSDYAAGSYLTYTLFGTAMNLLVLFPLFAFGRRFFPATRPYLLLGAVSLSGFVLVNYYFTWFKFAGAAFLLSAFCLLTVSRRARDWALAGGLLGIATNMHAGNAFSIPLFFLWFVWSHARETGWRNLRWLAGPALLCGLFVLAQLPWSLIKRAYFTEDYFLLSSFLFASHFSPHEGVLASIPYFLQRVPLSEQLPVRLSHLAAVLRPEDFLYLHELLRAGDWKKFFFEWSRKEFILPAILFGPGLMLLLADGLLRRAHPSVLERVRYPGELRALAFAALGSMLFVVFFAYGPDTPDALVYQPMGAALFFQFFLAGRLLNAHPVPRFLFLGLLGVAAGRLFAFL